MSAISNAAAPLPQVTPAHQTQLRRQLIAFTLIGMSLGLLHHIDHVIRGNHIGWPLTLVINPFTFSLLLYPLALVGLFYTMLRGRLVPGYWLAVALIGFGLISFTHFGPQAIEPLQDITTPYAAPTQYILTAPDSRIAFFRDVYAPVASPVWASTAVIILVLLMLSLALLGATAVRAYRVTGKWWNM